MSITLPTLTFGLGCALLVIAIIGGGLEVKEIKIPVLPIFPRALSGILGAMLVALVLMKPGLITALSNPPSDTPEKSFDGQWIGKGAGWEISGSVAKGEFNGNVDSCVRRNGTQAENIASIRGQVYADGSVMAETQPHQNPSEVRVITGRLPHLRIEAKFPKEVGCADADIQMEHTGK